MRKIAVFVIACYVVLLSFGCGNGLAQRPTMGKATDFELADINGNTLRLSDHSGKVIILNFFATWCPPCRMEMPDFNEISETYKGEVEIIAINLGDPVQKVKEFADELGLLFTIASDDGNVSNAYGPIRAIPVSVVIDKDFNIAKKYIGARPKEIFVGDIEELK